VRDSEIKFGLSVTGVVDPAELLTNAGARVGDRLVLTKPLGTGFVTTAAKKEECPQPLLERAIAQMIQLNTIGCEAFRATGGAHAVTDVTGYGLAGHAFEMAEGAGLTFEIEVDSLPVIEGAAGLATPRFFTRASKSNREFVSGKLQIASNVDPQRMEFAFDAQTSGGLLIAIAEERVPLLVEQLRERGAAAWALVGRVVERAGEIAVALR
jgi:selenide,water dikinase